MKKSVLTISAALLLPAMAVAQETEGLGASLGIDLVSQYIWRGQDLGGVSFQPTLGIDYKGFSLSAWGSAGFEKSDTKEVDLTIAYGIGGFSVGVTDYWFDNGPGYFKYKAHNTAHVFEANVGYDFGFASLNWYTNFAGNDGVTQRGKRAYSSYVEAAVPFKIASLDWQAEIGACPWSTTSYNTHGFAVINVAVGAKKEFTISDTFNFGVSAKLIANPRDDKAYFVCGLSLSCL